MSITAIARQAQGIRAGEVIAKLAEDAYFMRVDNRVNQPPPTRNHDNEATSRSANNGPNRTRAELPAEPNRTRSNASGPTQGGNSNREVVPHRALAGGGGHEPDGGGSDGGSSNHGANRRAAAVAVAAAEATQTATPLVPHRASTMPVRRLKSYGERSRPLQATTTASPPSHLDFATCSSPTSSNIWGSPSTTRSRTPSSGSGAKTSPSRTLAVTMTPSASTSPSAWTRLHSHGSSRWTSTQSTSGTS
jgi:hypothetical protein